jgi:protease I
MAKKILLLIENEFRDEEAVYPYYRFIEAGYDVKIVGPEIGKEYKGKFGLTMKSDIAASGIYMGDVAAVIIPGGNAPDKMRVSRSMVNLVKDAFSQHKIIAAICHGGQLLVEAGVVRGKKVTGYKAIATDLKNAGGKYVDEEVVVDGNLVTSRIPDDLPAFCRTTLELIKTRNRK